MKRARDDIKFLPKPLDRDMKLTFIKHGRLWEECVSSEKKLEFGLGPFEAKASIRHQEDKESIYSNLGIWSSWSSFHWGDVSSKGLKFAP